MYKTLLKALGKDKIKGGLADKKSYSDFNQKDLKEGQKVESEHTKDPSIAREIASDHLTEDSKYYKKLKTMEKGAMKRLAPFKPTELPISTREEMESWQEEQPQRSRNELDSEGMEPNARMRALHKLSGATKVRKGPDGKRQFLLHRGMDLHEYNHNKVGGKPNINHEIASSWTPNHGIAHGFKETYSGFIPKYDSNGPKGRTAKKPSGVVSAWIHEDHISFVPKQYGSQNPHAPKQNMVDRNEFAAEHEVIVSGGHNSEMVHKDHLPSLIGKDREDKPASATVDQQINFRAIAPEAAQHTQYRKQIQQRRKLAASDPMGMVSSLRKSEAPKPPRTPEYKEFKQKDKAVDSAGRKYDKNPHPENHKALMSAIKDREDHIDKHAHIKEHLNSVNKYMNEKWGGNRPMRKSNYGPKGMGQYSQADNAKRKQSNSADIETGIQGIKLKTGANATGGQGKQIFNHKMNEINKINRKQPVKTYSPEEKAALSAKMGLKKDDHPEYEFKVGNYKHNDPNSGLDIPMGTPMHSVDVYHQGKNVGHIVAQHNPNENSITIGDAALEKLHRGKGIGKAMYEKLYQHAAQHGVKSIETSMPSEEAERVHTSLARKHGFVFNPKKASNTYKNPFSKNEKQELGNHVIFSAENSPYPDKVKVKTTHKEALDFLRSKGEDAHEVNGYYGSPEKSIIVKNPKNKNSIVKLAHSLGQESVLHSDGKNHTLEYLHGPNAGKKVTGQGTNWHETKPNDNYTEMNGKFFTHNLNFGKSK